MMEAEMYGIMLSAKMVIRSKAPPENILNIPKIPPELRLNISAKTAALIPGRGIYVPKRKTIKAIIVNHNLFFNSSALLKADISKLAAIFSAIETISISLKNLKPISGHFLPIADNLIHKKKYIATK